MWGCFQCFCLLSSDRGGLTCHAPIPSPWEPRLLFSAGEPCSLCSGSSSVSAPVHVPGTFPDKTRQAAAALGHAARLASALLPPQEAEAAGDAAAPDAAGVALAARLMEVGARTADAWLAAAMKPHLARLLLGLCSPPCGPHNDRCGKPWCPRLVCSPAAHH